MRSPNQSLFEAAKQVSEKKLVDFCARNNIKLPAGHNPPFIRFRKYGGK